MISAERGPIIPFTLDGGVLLLIWMLHGLAMPTRFKVVAAVAVLAAGTTSAAMARYPCARIPYRHGVCQPVRSSGYSNPVSGAVSGEAPRGALRPAVPSVQSSARPSALPEAPLQAPLR